MPKKLTTISENQLVTIAGDGAISNPDIAIGKMIPVLILNCDNRQDLHDLIMLHQGLGPGDLSSSWLYSIFNRRYLYLKLEFSRPSPGVAVLPFETEKHALLIDGILRAHGVYLQSSSFATKLSEGFGEPMILVEVTSTPPFDWNKHLKKTIIKRYKRSGLNYKEASTAAKEQIQSSRRLWNFRRIPS